MSNKKGDLTDGCKIFPSLRLNFLQPDDCYDVLEHESVYNDYLNMSELISLVVDSGISKNYEIFDACSDENAWLLNVGGSVTAIEAITDVDLEKSPILIIAIMTTRFMPCLQVFEFETTIPTLKYIRNCERINTIRFLTGLTTNDFLGVASDRAFIIRVPHDPKSKFLLLKHNIPLDVKTISNHPENEIGKCTDLAWSKPYKNICAVYSSGIICLWTIGSAGPIFVRLLMPLNTPIIKVTFMPCSRSVVAVSYLNSRDLRVLDLLSAREQLCRFDLYAADLCSNEDGHQLLIGTDECDGKSQNSNIKQMIMWINHTTLSCFNGPYIDGHLTALYAKNQTILSGTSNGHIYELIFQSDKKHRSFSNAISNAKNRAVCSLQLIKHEELDDSVDYGLILLSHVA
ncbi:hypothetical protein ACOME3_009977 [Neoechinorhynchus agilis]